MNKGVEAGPSGSGFNPYGFEWGPMRVTRLAYVEGRGYVLEVRTDHQVLQVYVSEKGRKIKTYPREISREECQRTKDIA